MLFKTLKSITNAISPSPHHGKNQGTKPGGEGQEKPLLHTTGFHVKLRKSRYLRNGTSDHNFKILKTLFNTNYPSKPRKNHPRNHFRPLKSGFSAILRKKRIFTQTPPPMDDLRRSGFCLCSYSSN